MCLSVLLSALSLCIGGNVRAEDNRVAENTGIAQQSTTLRGNVQDDLGPVAGASVIVKGTTNGTITDVNGDFSLQVSRGAVIQISFIGYVTQEVTYTGQSNLQVKLVEDAQTLAEVVVTALGIKREKRSIGFAQETVKGEAFVKAAAPNVISALSGKVAGVIIPATNTLEGGSTRIVIRGNNSIDKNKNNQPLFIVDGVPITNDPGTTSNESGTDWGSSANDLNAFDIEDMSILKGPAAAALYGARGANGVILITTKKGAKHSGIGIDFNASIISTDFYRYGDYQNEYGQGSLGYASQWGIPPFQKNAAGDFTMAPFDEWNGANSWGPRMDGTMVRWWDGELRPYSPLPDNIKSIWESGLSQTYNVAFSGGSEKGTIRLSATHYDNSGFRINSGQQRTTLNLGGHLMVSEKISADVNISYFDNHQKNFVPFGHDNTGGGKIWNYLLPRSYNLDLEKDIWKNPDGTRNDNGGPGGKSMERYYYWRLNTLDDSHYKKRLLGSIAVNYDIASWLKAKVQLGMDNENIDNIRYQPPRDVTGTLDGRYGRQVGRNIEYNHEASLIATKENIFPDINVTGGLGGVYYKRDYYLMRGGTDTNMSSPYIYLLRNYDPANTNFKNNIPEEDFFRKEVQSVYAYLNLSYKNYAFLDVTGRNDWSSTLPQGNNSYFYPSVNGSFVFTDAFDWKSDAFSYGKVRIAHAYSASDETPFLLDPTFASGTLGTATWNKLPGAVPSTNLKPQKTNTWEFGGNLGFFNDRLTLEFTYFDTNSTNQILDSPLPLSSGASGMRINEGQLQTKGFEFMVNLIPVRTKDFRWDLTLTGTRSRNKLLRLVEGAEKVNLGGIFGNDGPSIELVPGQNYGVIYGYDFLYDDNGNRIVNADGKSWQITASKVAIGNATPDLTGGIMNSFRYKNISLSAFIDMSIGGDMWYGSYATMTGFGGGANTVKERNGGGLPYSWTDPDGVGHTANIGVILDGVREVNGAYVKNDIVTHYTDFYKHYGSWGRLAATPSVYDNTWVNFRELILSYQLDSKLLSKVKFIQGATLSLVGRNLFYIYDNAPLGLNPGGSNGAGNSQGIEFGANPVSRSYGFTLNLSF
jgi:iron complex outermembrane receptor protein